MMTSATTGRIRWAKNFLLNTEPNDVIQEMYAIMDVKMTDDLWIRIDKETLANDISFSRFLKLDQDSGNVLTSFQLTNKLTGLNLKVYKVYFISNDELIISLDSNQTYNKFGLTQNSKQDSVILKINITSGSIFADSI